jgi:hypothetical protein
MRLLPATSRGGLRLQACWTSDGCAGEENQRVVVVIVGWRIQRGAYADRFDIEIG